MSDPIVVRIDPDLEDIAPRYLDNKTREIARIDEALDRQDFETARLLGHSMKGSGGGYGFTAISAIGADIEQAAKAGDAAAIRHKLEELADYVSRVNVVYEEEPEEEEPGA